MAKARELKNIAGGILGTFVSRYNDVDGYWGIGKLRTLAQAHAVSLVAIDLLAPSMTPHEACFEGMLDTYVHYLRARLDAAGIPLDQVSGASITLDFAPAGPVSIYRLTWGALFTLCVTLTGHRGKSFSVCAQGHCGAHDPCRERRSGRAA